MPTEKQLHRMATRIRNALSAVAGGPQTTTAVLDDVLDRTRVLEKKSRLLSTALARGWSRAVTELRRDIASVLERLGFAVRTAEAAARRPPSGPPRTVDIVAELKVLDGEFADFTVDLRQKIVSAVTEPIELEGIDLGRFRIELHVERLARSADPGCLTMVALDPNPASGDDSVTHPHVRNGRLCTGEADAPIRNALSEGRVGDAFVLVRSVLDNYAADSPYIGLDEWRGETCYDCGNSVGRDDLSYCESCDRDFCGRCVSHCRACDNTCCEGCLSPCPVCEEPCCGRCRKKLPGSDRECCIKCIKTCGLCGDRFPKDESDAAVHCPECRDNLEPETVDEESEPTPAAAG